MGAGGRSWDEPRTPLVADFLGAGPLVGLLVIIPLACMRIRAPVILDGGGFPTDPALMEPPIVLYTEETVRQGLEMAETLTYPDLREDAEAERDWIRRVREGDADLYRLLVERYQSRIYRLVSRLLGPSHGEVEDVVQDVFVKAYFSLKSFREDSSFRTWITRIAINRARDELKKQSRNVALNEEISQESIEQMSDYLTQPEKEEPPPHYTETVGRLVAGAVASLPERLRVVVTLKDMEGLSYQEVSQVLRCSVGTVKSRHARARGRLRQLLTEHAPELLRR